MERPILSKQLDSRTFRSFYYLKEELVSFCMFRITSSVFQRENRPSIYF